MEWWKWIAASTEAILILVLLALRMDTLRDRVGWDGWRAFRVMAPWAVLAPAGFGAVLLLPWWLGLILIAIPALAILAMEMAS